ncbi:hypothetical protein TWF481_006472 [Arthrobotrys musiformis]|uniref:Extracellular membrane protein CFEM domain-containing protein n=1 Tax=Arthrobotrys musiformis TaxID=47236 RepID=A0AAV9WAH3_9PEZI
MSTPALPLLTKWSCADTCITAYDGFCERFTFTNIWPATAQCLLGTCSDKDRIALQKTVAEYCDAVGYPDVWGPYMWGATDDNNSSRAASVKSSVPPTSSPTPVISTTQASSSTPESAPPPATVTIINNAAATTSTLSESTPLATAPSESQASKSSGLPTGAKAGIAVGIVFVAVLIFLIWFFLRWRRRKNEPNFPEGPDHSPTPSPKVKDFEEAPVISYSIEGGMLTRKDKPNLSIKVL